MSSWDTPSAVSVGEKPKSHHQSRNWPAGEGTTQKPKGDCTNQIAEVPFTKDLDQGAHQVPWIHWSTLAISMSFTAVLQAQPQQALQEGTVDRHTTAQHQTQNLPFTHWNFPPAHLSLGWIQTEYHGALYLNSCGKKRILYKRETISWHNRWPKDSVVIE